MKAFKSFLRVVPFVVFLMTFGFATKSEAQCSNMCRVDFQNDGTAADGTGFFSNSSYTDVNTGMSNVQIADGTAGNNSVSYSFDIFDASSGDCITATDGIDDITIDLEVLPVFDPYGGVVGTPGTGGEDRNFFHDGVGIKTSTDFIGGSFTSTTGDVYCYEYVVKFTTPQVASDAVARVTSINTAGQIFESASVAFLDASMNPYGTATYNGFWNGNPGGSGGTNGCDGTNNINVEADIYTTTGNIFVAADPGSITTSVAPNTGTYCFPENGSSGPDNNETVEADADTGLVGSAVVTGFIYTICLEDVAVTCGGDDLPTNMGSNMNDCNDPGGSNATNTTFTNTLSYTELCNSSCPDLTGLTDGMLDIGVTESECTVFGGENTGGETTAPTTACPTGSTLMYSTDGGTSWSEDLPDYNQTTAITVDTRCECDADDTVVSPTSSVTTVPGPCPDCPDLSGLTDGMLDVALTESSCSVPNGTPAGGTVSAPTTACPAGSTLMYSIDGGAWTATLPADAYNQTEAVTIETRCECDADDTVVSPTSSVTTDPGECPDCPAVSCTAGLNFAVCIGDEISLSETGDDAEAWSWTGPDGFTSTDQSPTIASATDAAGGTYTVVVTDENGCEGMCSVVITINPLPPVEFVVTEFTCDETCQNTITFHADGISLPGTYAWTGPDGFTSDMQVIGGEADCLASGTYTLMFTDGNGCSNTGSIEYNPEACIDLALIKELATTTTLRPGLDVAFDITVYNQGTTDAFDVDVADYYPTCLTLPMAEYTSHTGATMPTVSDLGLGVFTISEIPAGEEVVVTLTFTIDVTCTETTITNNSEITGGALAAGGDDAMDADSTPGDDGDSPPDPDDDDTDDEDGGDDFDPATFTICNTGCGEFPWDGNE